MFFSLTNIFNFVILVLWTIVNLQSATEGDGTVCTKLSSRFQCLDLGYVYIY